MKTFPAFFVVLVLAGCAINTTAPDRDNARRVSQEEFARIIRSQGFDAVDKNHDGIITWDEWRQFDTTTESREHFDSFDTSRDGKISRDEWKTGLDKTRVSIGLFKQLDADNDGYLGANELKNKPVSGLFQLKF
jgi:Ca2+-binding EF-hand superfamily protein